VHSLCSRLQPFPFTHSCEHHPSLLFSYAPTIFRNQPSCASPRRVFEKREKPSALALLLH
jgi:hypothetical protein